MLRDALAKTKKVAVGQLVMHGREHLVGITALGKGLALFILRYGDEVRDAEPYFGNITAKPSDDAVALAVDLVEQESGNFEPQKLPNEYARAVQELVQAKVERRAPSVEIVAPRGDMPKVVNIMDALKKSMQAKGQMKVKEAVRKKMGKLAPKQDASPGSPRSRSTHRRTAH